MLNTARVRPLDPEVPVSIRPTSRQPREHRDVILKLAEQSKIYLVKEIDNRFEIVETYTLTDLAVSQSLATWSFTDSAGRKLIGAHTAIHLHPELSVKLGIPIVLHPSKSGLRAEFCCRTHTGYRVFIKSVFENLK